MPFIKTVVHIGAEGVRGVPRWDENTAVMINDVHFPVCTTEPITYLSISILSSPVNVAWREVGIRNNERNCCRNDSVAGSERRLESAVVIACSRPLP